jgi:hypothetical protein
MKEQLNAWQASLILVFYLLIILGFALFYRHVIIPHLGYQYWAGRLFELVPLSIFAFSLTRLYKIDFPKRIEKPKFKEVFLIAIIAIVAIIVVLPLTYPAEYRNSILFEKNAAQLPGNEFTFYQNSQYLIFGCIISPIIEEIIYRRIVLGGLILRYPTLRTVIILSIVFGVLHFKISFAAVIVLGLVVSYIYVITDSLVLAILFHMMWNSFDLAFSFFRAQLSNVLTSYWYLGIFAIGVTIIFLLLNELRKFENFKKAVSQFCKSTTSETMIGRGYEG